MSGKLPENSGHFRTFRKKSAKKKMLVDSEQLGLPEVYGGPGRFRKVREACGNISTNSGIYKSPWCRNEKNGLKTKISKLVFPNVCRLDAGFPYFGPEFRVYMKSPT